VRPVSAAYAGGGGWRDGVALLAQVLAQALLHGFASFAWAFIPKCIAYAFLVAVTAKEAYIKAIGNVEAKKAALVIQSKETENNC